MSTVVLMAGDCLSSQAGLRESLVSAGFAVATIALKSLASYPSFKTISAVVVDVSEATPTYVQPINALRENDINVPVLVISGEFDDAALKEIREQVNVNTLRKPCTNEVVRGMVSALARPPKDTYLVPHKRLATVPDNRTLARGEVGPKDLIQVGSIGVTQSYADTFLLERIYCRQLGSKKTEGYWRLKRRDGALLPSKVAAEVYRGQKPALTSVLKYLNQGQLPKPKETHPRKGRKQSRGHQESTSPPVGPGRPTGATTKAGVEVYLYELVCQLCQKVYPRELPKGTAAYRRWLCPDCFRKGMDVECRDRAIALTLPDFDEGTPPQQVAALRIRNRFLREWLKQLGAGPDNDLQDRLLCEVAERTDAKWWVKQLRSGTLAEQFTLTKSACSNQP